MMTRYIAVIEETTEAEVEQTNPPDFLWFVFTMIVVFLILGTG